MIENPHLIQRCELQNGKLEYDIMGNSDFEAGGQAKALKRLFSRKGSIVCAQLRVNVAGKEVAVYMVAGEGYPFPYYRPHLQRLAERGVAGEELTDFDEAAKEGAGVEFARTYPDTNVWFDFPNEILWTLTEESQRELVRVLEGIREGWGVKDRSCLAKGLITQ